MRVTRIYPFFNIFPFALMNPQTQSSLCHAKSVFRINKRKNSCYLSNLAHLIRRHHLLFFLSSQSLPQFVFFFSLSSSNSTWSYIPPKLNFLRYEIPDQNDNEYEKRETLMEFRSHTCVFKKITSLIFASYPEKKWKTKKMRKRIEYTLWRCYGLEQKKKLISRRVIDKNIESKKKILLWYYGRERVFISVGKTCPFLVMCCHFPNTRQVLVFPSETELSF